MIYVNFAKLEHENDLVSFINKSQISTATSQLL